jgi:phosphoribosylamine-glycine ligase
MPKYRLIGTHAESVGLALRLQQEGHEVSIYVKDPEAKNVYAGIIEKSSEPIADINKNTIVIYDTVKFGAQADNLLKSGFKVYGGSQIADDLELDRSFGIPVAVNAGIAVPRWEEFKDFKNAAKFAEELDAPCVFKPESNKEGIQTYVSTSPEDMIKMLEYFEKRWTGKVDFILQEAIDGIEVSSEVWVSNGIIVPNSYNNTWETKKLMNGDLGPNTGCMSSSVKFNGVPWLYPKTFGKLEKWIKAQKYNGPLDINCIVKDGEPYFLEWTARFGYSAIYAFINGIGMGFGDFLESLAIGNWLGALRICIPPYPSEECKESENQPVSGIEDDEYIFPLDIKKSDDMYLTAGYDGIVCEVTDTSDSLPGLWESIYRTADKLQIPNKMYRTDAMTNAKERVDSLGVYDELL